MARLGAFTIPISLIPFAGGYLIGTMLVLNLVAALWFIGAGLIDWPRVAVMTAGAVVGYYLGSHYSQRISQARVRQIITAIGFIISGVTFYKQFVR